ncbi:MAG: MerR family transcriptional regulator [Lachnospiraceae bacterium]|nr:MerR family transcriptional regulator [Lachnospiraceae bacterium]
MLTIGEFSNICKVSTKTLRYYAEIGLLEPSEINPENGYRYYAIEQLERMLFINRLKAYSFSLDEIKTILQSEEVQDDSLYLAFVHKKKEIEKQVHNYKQILAQLEDDIKAIEEGKSIMAYMEDIDVQLVELPKMYLLSIRKNVQVEDYPAEYSNCFGKLFKRIAVDKLTITGAPMALFHSSEFSPSGLDTEFAIPVKEYATGTRDFCPGLCLRTVVHGYTQLSSVYAKQIEWAEKEGYQGTNALFEVYVTDPSQVTDEMDHITEVYYPVKKISL